MDINRKTAYLTLVDIESKKAYSNIALNHKIAMNKPESPAFVRELVYGVLENKLTLDWYINQMLKQGIESIKTPELTILRMGVYQISFMDSVPEYAAVNESTNLAKRYCKGRTPLVNGVLRQYQKKKDSMQLPDRDSDEILYLSVRYSYAPWIVELWLEQFPSDKVEKLLEAGNGRPPLTLRVNSLKVTAEDMKKALEDRGYRVSRGSMCQQAINVRGSGILESELYRHGLFSPQDESSMLASEKTGAVEGELVMDVCAAPGGKTTAIAEGMRNTGKVIASDIYSRKLDIIDKEAARLGITNIETKPWDATKVDSTMLKKADRVLVDAPCSGLGVVRRKPEIKYKAKDRDMESLPDKQLAILSASAAYVKEGGTLVYSTCTINRLENEEVAERFLARNSNFEKVEEIQLLPSENETDGFFICVMKEINR